MVSTKNGDMGPGMAARGVQLKSLGKTGVLSLVEEEEFKIFTQPTYFPCTSDQWISK